MLWLSFTQPRFFANSYEEFMKITKKVLLIVSLLLSFGAWADKPVEPIDTLHAELITQDIQVKANATNHAEVVLQRKELHGAILCNTFNAPGKHVQVQASVNGEDGKPVWIDSVTKDCTALDTLPEPIDLGEYGTIKFNCRNFDPIDRVCHVKALVYTK